MERSNHRRGRLGSSHDPCRPRCIHQTARDQSLNAAVPVPPRRRLFDNHRTNMYDDHRTMSQTETRYRAVLAVTGVALFMIVLDNLIVMSSLPAIERSLGATLEQLEWVIDAYILSFAVLMLTGAALGERFGRRRVLVIGLLLFHRLFGGRGAGVRQWHADRGARAPGRR